MKSKPEYEYQVNPRPGGKYQITRFVRINDLPHVSDIIEVSAAHLRKIGITITHSLEIEPPEQR